MRGNPTLADPLIVPIDGCLHLGRLHQRVHDDQLMVVEWHLHFLGSDGVELNVQAGVLLAQVGDRLIHATRSRPHFALEPDATLDELLLAQGLGSVGVVRDQGRTHAESRGTGDAGRPGDVALDKDMQANYFLLLDQVENSRPVARNKILNIARLDPFPHFARVLADLAARKLLSQHMLDHHCLGLDPLEGDKAVLLDGCRQDSVALVVDMLADDVDSTGGARDEVWD